MDEVSGRHRPRFDVHGTEIGLGICWYLLHHIERELRLTDQFDRYSNTSLIAAASTVTAWSI